MSKVINVIALVIGTAIDAGQERAIMDTCAIKGVNVVGFHALMDTYDYDTVEECMDALDGTELSASIDALASAKGAYEFIFVLNGMSVDRTVALKMEAEDKGFAALVCSTLAEIEDLEASIMHIAIDFQILASRWIPEKLERAGVTMEMGIAELMLHGIDPHAAVSDTDIAQAFILLEELLLN